MTNHSENGNARKIQQREDIFLDRDLQLNLTNMEICCSLAFAVENDKQLFQRSKDGN